MSIYTYNGGTVIAMAGDECVCIASDLRLGEQMNLVATDMKKMYKLSDRVYIGMAGFQSDAQTVLEKLRFQVGLYELRENRKMSPKVAATMASNLLYKHRFGGYIVGPVVAGLDPVTNKSFVSASDGIGCVTNPKDFVATGCGAEYALNLCEGFWRENMGPDELFEATAQAMLSAIDRDASSGYGVVIYTITKDKVTSKTIACRMD